MAVVGTIGVKSDLKLSQTWKLVKRIVGLHRGTWKDKTEPCTPHWPWFGSSHPRWSCNSWKPSSRAGQNTSSLWGISHWSQIPRCLYSPWKRKYSLVFNQPGTLGLDNLAQSSLPTRNISKGYGRGRGVSCMCWMEATNLQPKDTFCSTNLFPFFPSLILLPCSTLVIWIIWTD